MKRIHRLIVASLVSVLLLLAISAYGQVHKYFTPGTVWGVTTIRIHPGMDQAYLEYLDTQLKKESDISIKNGFMKSYKILRSQDDDSGWNMLILREYDSFASLEKNAEKQTKCFVRLLASTTKRACKGISNGRKYEMSWARSSCAN